MYRAIAGLGIAVVCLAGTVTGQEERPTPRSVPPTVFAPPTIAPQPAEPTWQPAVPSRAPPGRPTATMPDRIVPLPEAKPVAVNVEIVVADVTWDAPQDVDGGPVASLARRLAARLDADEESSPSKGESDGGRRTADTPRRTADRRERAQEDASSPKSEPRRPRDRAERRREPRVRPGWPERARALADELAGEGRITFFAAPRVMTLNVQPATVHSGHRKPRLTGTTMGPAGRASSVTMENVGMILAVTPRVDDDGAIFIEFMLERSDFAPEDEGPVLAAPEKGEPIRAAQINTLTVNTTLRVADGRTVIVSQLQRLDAKTHESFILLRASTVEAEK